MNSKAPSDMLAAFATKISNDTGGDAPFVAMYELARDLIGARLFTIMTVDIKAGVVRRHFTSDPQNYPTSGTKPIEHNRWFEIVYGQRRAFVANTIAEIAELFADHEKIRSLGLGSVINIPVVVNGEFLGTVNCLNVENHYSTLRVHDAKLLVAPAQIALSMAIAD